jgi:uncharacterized protein (DUF427 family)
MKVVFNGQVVAEADKADLVFIEGNWYFPPSSVKPEFFAKSDTPYTCPWKGVCQYYNIKVGDQESQDTAWTYPEPLPTAIERVKKDFAGYFAFWKEKVEINE